MAAAAIDHRNPTTPAPQGPDYGPTDPNSQQPNPQEPENEQPPRVPDNRICGEPRGVSYQDPLNNLCYDLVLPCGVGEELAADRYREQHGLERNPAVRYFSSESVSQGSASSVEEKDSTSCLINGARAYVREVVEFFEGIQIPSLFGGD